MRSRFIPLVVVCSLGWSSAVTAQDVCLRWAEVVVPNPTDPPSAPENALGRPDGLQTKFGEGPADEATYSSFQCDEFFGEASFASFLGVSEAVLQQADFVAFERNGALGFTFEGSTWTFAAGGMTEAFQAPTEAFASGVVTTSAYESFFGISVEPGGEWPFVLFDLQQVDPSALDFEVTVLRGPTVQDTPDVDAMGVVAGVTPTASAQVVRLGSPPNPNALLPGVTSGPVLGAVWDPVIDHTTFLPGATVDLLAVTPNPLNLSTGLGTLLCDPTTILVLESVPAGTPFVLPVPVNCSLIGFPLCSQGGSADAVSLAVGLTNALDITVGTF